ncbi:ileal sodium/bile acid cotransporter-like [Watersipora subatra]|uniref:ileal sodium/bile acid cotransporter-like n=1 Tax=Watersipora subatra TaxID=2589382 RepID=UPI00355C751B
MHSFYSLFFTFCLAAGYVSSWNPANSSSTDSGFRIVPPEEGLLTIYYDYPPTLCQVLLYVDGPVKNFSISIESVTTSVATVSGESAITRCQEKITSNVSSNANNLSHTEVTYDILQEAGTCYNISFYGNAVYIGYSTLKFYVRTNGSQELSYIDDLLLRSIRRRRPIDKVFDISFKCITIMTVMAMGTDLEFQTIRDHLRRPKAPGIALLSQFLIMPMLAYSIVWIFGYTGGKALGFFAMGCCPGGGTSNMYSKLFNGDLSLSVTMTTLSTAASFGMLPLWIYTLGRTIPADEGVDKVKLPFLNILQSLSFMVIPLAIGSLIKYKFPRAAAKIRRGLDILFILVVISVLTILIYANQYIFVAFDAKLVLSACLLPYCGYIFGGFLAWACRFDWPLIKTIAIETGIQNTAVTILIALSLSGQPDADLAVILPIASNIVSAGPFYLSLPIYLLRQRMLKKRATKKAELESKGSDTLTGEESDEKQTFEIEENSSMAEKERPHEMKLID